MTRPDALVFDCDGTLVDSMPAHYRAWCEALAPVGLTLEERRFYALGGVSTRAIVELLAREQGVSIDVDAIARARDEAFFRSSAPVTAVAPVVEIARAHRGVLPMGIATGGVRRQAETGLRAIGVLSWFSAMASADDDVRPKPAPDVFELAAARLGVDPRRCRAYEDTDVGLAAAQAAGMDVVDIRRLLDDRAGGSPSDRRNPAAG
ncbi:MAG: HAD-IA family hydrolase [Myxococcales bacterium FL481]|nr:MAG: HAD-IA family hydrolase [Myxococcales bacterium FL481]